MSKTRDTVSYEAVAQAMAAIASEGSRPTVRRVQAEVGGGSHTTLLAHIKRFNDEQRAAIAAGPAAGILTPEVSAALVAWTRQREESAKQDADQRVVEIDELYRAAKEGWEKADARIEELEAGLERFRAEAAEQEQGLKSEIAALQTRIEGDGKQLAELKEQLQREQQSSEASRLSAAEARIKADAAQESIKTLGKANDEMRSEIRIQSKALGEAEQRAAVAEERAKNRDEQLQEARTAAAKSGSAAEELQKRLSETEKRLSAAERDLAVCREQHQRGGRRGGEGQGGGGSGPDGGAGGPQDGGARAPSGKPDASKEQDGKSEASPPAKFFPQTALMRSLTDEEKKSKLDAMDYVASRRGYDLRRGETKHPPSRAHANDFENEEIRP